MYKFVTRNISKTDEDEEDEETDSEEYEEVSEEEEDEEDIKPRGLALVEDHVVEANQILRDPVQFDRLTFIGACICIAGLQFLPTFLFYRAGLSNNICLGIQWFVFWLVSYAASYFNNLVSYSRNVWLHVYPLACAIIFGIICMLDVSDLVYARLSKAIAKVGGTIIALIIAFPFSEAKYEMFWCCVLFTPLFLFYALGRAILVEYPHVGWASTLFAQLPTICKITMQNLSTTFISKYTLIPRRWINLQGVTIINLVYISRVMSICVLDWGSFAFNAALCLMFDLLDGQVMFDRLFHCLFTCGSNPRPPFVMPTMIEAVLVSMIEWSKAPLILIIVYWGFSVASHTTSSLWDGGHIARAATYICVVQPLFLGIDWLIDKKLWGNWKSETRGLIDANKYGQHKQSAAYEKTPEELDTTGERRFRGFPRPEQPKGPLGLSHETWAHIYVAYAGFLMIDNVVSITLGWCDSSRVEQIDCASMTSGSLNATLDVIGAHARINVGGLS